MITQTDIENLNRMYALNKPTECAQSSPSRLVVQKDILRITRMAAVVTILQIPDAMQRCEEFLCLAKEVLRNIETGA
jgi:hypothetical protein